MSWISESIAAIAFTPPGTATPDALEIWNRLNVGNPDSFNRQSGGPMFASTLAQGGFKGNRLTISTQIGRIDFQVSASPTADATRPPDIADWENSTRGMIDLIAAALRSLTCVRLAAVLHFVLPLENGASAVDVLAKYKVPASFPVGSIDLIYQFNDRSNLGIDGNPRINKIIQWASGGRQLITIGSAGPGSGGGPANMTLLELSIVSLHLDLSTIVSADVMQPDKSLEVIRALFHEAISIRKAQIDA